jgi:hypothetical protein
VEKENYPVFCIVELLGRSYSSVRYDMGEIRTHLCVVIVDLASASKLLDLTEGMCQSAHQKDKV